MPYVIVIDVGGTNLRIGVLDSSGKLVGEPQRFKSPNFLNNPQMSALELQDELVNKILTSVKNLLQDYKDLKINDISISIPGPVNKEGVVYSAAPLWGKSSKVFPLRARLKETLNMRWHVQNDISAAIYRYAKMPKYNTCRKICLITVSSGIGNKIFDLVHQELDIDSQGLSGELGHIRVDMSEDALVCDCQARGHLGAYSSGRGTERFARKMAKGAWDEEYRNSKLYEFTEGNPDKITTFNLIKSIKEKDKFSLKVFNHTISLLGSAIAVLAQAAAVDKFIIIGGFVRALADEYIKTLRKNLIRIGIFARDDRYVENLVELGILDDNNGLIGAGLLVQSYKKN